MSEKDTSSPKSSCSHIKTCFSLPSQKAYDRFSHYYVSSVAHLFFESFLFLCYSVDIIVTVRINGNIYLLTVDGNISAIEHGSSDICSF